MTVQTDTVAASASPTFGEAFRLWFKIGCINFGGPAGQIAMMHRMLVDEKKWIDEQRYLSALNFCMLLPGPEAMQLATALKEKGQNPRLFVAPDEGHGFAKLDNRIYFYERMAQFLDETIGKTEGSAAAN